MNKDNKYKYDYNDFIQSKEVAPRKLTHSIFDKVKADLNPNKQLVFLKLLSVQMFTGLITMLFCPQFKMSLTNNHDLFHYFHHNFGAQICMILCGAIFLGSGAIVAAYSLDLEEVRIIKNSKGLYTLAISGLSLGVFLLFGAKLYLDLTLLWVLGAFIAGTVMLAFNGFLRRKFLQLV